MILLNTFLSIQTFAAVVSLIGALIVVSVVFFLISSSTNYEDKKSAKKKVYKARARYFFGLASVIVVLLFISLRLLPYPSFQKTPDKVVTVVGMQWAWKMGEGTSDKSPSEFVGGNEITLPANKAVRFIVMSSDVNHNFAIYNSEGELVAQTQAMPGYNNELEYTFPHHGEYSVLCLEYCGLAHSIMMGKIHVN